MSRASSLFDLLPWDELVGDGILRNVDGALVASFRLRGPDLTAATDHQVEAIHRAIEQVAVQLGDGWMCHYEAQRFPAPPYPGRGSFPDPWTRAIDEERRRLYDSREHYESRYYLTLSYRPPEPDRPVAESLRRLVGPRLADREADERQLVSFESQLEKTRALLAAHLEIERLTSRALVRYLYQALTHRAQPLSLPRFPVALESIFGAGDLLLGFDVQLAERHIVPVALAGFPDASTPDSLEWLDRAPYPYHAVWRFQPLDPFTARTAIERRRTQWTSASLNLRQVVASLLSRQSSDRTRNRYESSMAEDTDEALFELARRETTAGFLTSVILLSDPDRAVATARAEQVVAELRNRGFSAWIETTNAAAAYLGALPGCGWYNLRRPMCLARNWVDLALTTSTWTGSPEHPHPRLRDQPAHVIASGSGATPFFLNLAHGDIQHTLIVGPTGAGKSVLVGTLVAQYLRYPEAQVIAIDKGRSLYALALAAGGHHYALSPGQDGQRFAPLANLDEPADRERSAEWLEEILRLQDVTVYPEHRQALRRALDLLAESPRRTLSTYLDKVQNRELREAFEVYARGAYATLFDGRENPLRTGHLHVVEMEDVLPLREAVVTPLLLHLFAEIERRLDGRPTLIIVEEALNYLSDTLWSRRLSSWLYELRKRNAGLIVVGQSLNTFLRSQLRDALIENCPNRIWLPNPAALEPAVAEGYETFGLNARQIEAIGRALPRRDYYYTSPQGSRLFSLDLSPAALSILGLAGPDARRRIDDLLAQHGASWLDVYLRSRGHEEFADLLTVTDSQELAHA